MKIVKQSFEILSDFNRVKALKLIEQSARTCYKSECNITEDSASAFVRKIAQVKKHESCIEHYSVTVKFICETSSYYPDDFNPTYSYEVWQDAMHQCELSYFALLKLNYSSQIARSVLPNALKTEIVITANLREWKHIFLLRTSKQAHPQMRELMIPVFEHFKNTLPEIFDDIHID